MKNVKMKVYTDYLQEIGEKAIKRWRKYLATLNPMPRQVEFNRILGDITVHKLVQSSTILPNKEDKKAKKKIEKT